MHWSTVPVTLNGQYVFYVGCIPSRKVNRRERSRDLRSALGAVQGPHGGPGARLSAGDGSDDHKRLGAGRHRFGQGSVRRLVRQVLLAGEEPQKGATLASAMFADGSA